MCESFLQIKSKDAGRNALHQELTMLIILLTNTSNMDAAQCEQVQATTTFQCMVTTPFQHPALL